MKKQNDNSRMIVAVLIAFLLGGWPAVRAATTWTGTAGGGLWSTAGNWDNGTPTTNAAITAGAYLTNTTASYTVNYDLSSSVISNLTVANSGANFTTLVIGNNKTLNDASSSTDLSYSYPIPNFFLYQDNSRLVVQSGATNSAFYQFFSASSASTPAQGLIENGGVLIAGGQVGNNAALQIVHSVVTNRGEIVGYWRNGLNQPYFEMAGNATLVVDGGKLLVPGQLSMKAWNGDLTITNGGSYILDYAAMNPGRGLYIGGTAADQTGVGSIVNRVNVYDGVVTNRLTLHVGDSYAALADAHTNWDSRAELNLYNGSTFVLQTGAASAETVLGGGRVGVINVNGGDFLANGSVNNDIYVGGTNTVLMGAGVQRYGEINLNSGSFALTNNVSNPTLFVGSAVTTGRVNITGGTMTLDKLVATNGGYSVVNLSGGTLTVQQSTLVDNGSVFTVGNGTSAATLNLPGGTHSFANGLSISSNATLKGAGTITGGTLVVNSGGTLSPGNSPGTLTTPSETWNGGGTYLWEVDQVDNGAVLQSTLQGADPGADWLNITGSLAINATGGDPFTIKIDGLQHSGHALGAVANWDNTGYYTWVLATANGGVSGFDPSAFLLDLSGFTAYNGLGGGAFSLTADANNLYLNFYQVPEPSVLLLLMAGGLLLFRRRRNRD